MSMLNAIQINFISESRESKNFRFITQFLNKKMLTLRDFVSEAANTEHLSGIKSSDYPLVVSWLTYCARNDLYDELEKLLISLHSISVKRFLFHTVLVELSTSADPRNYESFLKLLFSIPESSFDLEEGAETQRITDDCDLINRRFIKLLESNTPNIFPLSSEVIFSSNAASFCSSILSFALSMEACGQVFYSLEFIDLCLTAIPEEFFMLETGHGTDRENLISHKVNNPLKKVVFSGKDGLETEVLYLAIQELFVHLSHFCHFISIGTSEISSTFSFSLWTSMTKEEKVAYHLKTFMYRASLNNVSFSSKHLSGLIIKSFRECFDSELSLYTFLDHKTFQKIILAHQPLFVDDSVYSQEARANRQEEKPSSLLIIPGDTGGCNDPHNDKSTEMCVLESLLFILNPFDYSQFHLVSAFISSFFNARSIPTSKKELIDVEDHWNDDGLSDLASELSQQDNVGKSNYSVSFYLNLFLLSVVKFNDIDSGLSVILETLEKVFQSPEVLRLSSLLPGANPSSGVDEFEEKLVLELYELESICTMAKIVKSYSSVPPLSIIALPFVIRHTFPKRRFRAIQKSSLSSDIHELKMNRYLFKKQLLCSCQSFAEQTISSFSFFQLVTSSESVCFSSFLRFDLLSCSVEEILLINMARTFCYDMEEDKSRFYHQQQSTASVDSSSLVTNPAVPVSSSNNVNDQKSNEQKRQHLQRFQRRLYERTSDFLSDFLQLISCHFFDNELSRRFKTKKNDWLIFLLLQLLSFVLKGLYFNTSSLSVHEEEDLEKEFKELISVLIFECSLPDLLPDEDVEKKQEGKTVGRHEISKVSSTRDVALKLVSFFSDSFSKSHIISFVLSSIILPSFNLRDGVFAMDSYRKKQARYYLDILLIVDFSSSCISLFDFVAKCVSILQLLEFSEKWKFSLYLKKPQAVSLSCVQAMTDGILSEFDRLKSLSKAKTDFFHSIIQLKTRNRTVSDEIQQFGEDFLKLIIDLHEIIGFVSVLSSITGPVVENEDEIKNKNYGASCISDIHLSSAEKLTLFRRYFSILFRISLNLRDLPTACQFCLSYINQKKEIKANETSLIATEYARSCQRNDQGESVPKLIIAFLKIIRDNPHYQNEFQLIVSSCFQNLNAEDFVFVNQQVHGFLASDELFNQNLVINNVESLLSSLTANSSVGSSTSYFSVIVSPSLFLAEDELYFSLKGIPNQEFVEDYLRNYLNNVNREIEIISSTLAVSAVQSSAFPTSSSFNEILVNKLVKSGFSISGAKKSVYETRSVGTFEAALQYAVTHSSEINFDCPVILTTNDEELLLNEEKKKNEQRLIQMRSVYSILEMIWLKLFPSVPLPHPSLQPVQHGGEIASMTEKNLAFHRTIKKEKPNPSVIRLTVECEDLKNENLVAFERGDQVDSRDEHFHIEVFKAGGVYDGKMDTAKPSVPSVASVDESSAVNFSGSTSGKQQFLTIDPQLTSDPTATSLLEKFSRSETELASESAGQKVTEMSKSSWKDLLSLKFLEVYHHLRTFSTFSLSPEEFLEFIFPSSISESDLSTSSTYVTSHNRVLNSSSCANWFVKIITRPKENEEGFDFLVSDFFPSVFRLILERESSSVLPDLLFSSLIEEMMTSIDEPFVRLLVKRDLLSFQSTSVSARSYKGKYSVISSIIAVSAFLRYYSLLSTSLADGKWEDPVSNNLRRLIISKIPVVYYHLLCWFYDNCESVYSRKSDILRGITFLKKEIFLLIESFDIEAVREDETSSVQVGRAETASAFNMIVHYIRKQTDSNEAVNDSIIEEIGTSVRKELIIKWKKDLSEELQLLKKTEKFPEEFRESVSWKSFLQSGLFAFSYLSFSILVSSLLFRSSNPCAIFESFN
jgi:hypothetical protein